MRGDRDTLGYPSSSLLLIIGLLAILAVWSVPVWAGVNSFFFADQSTGLPKYYAMYLHASHGSYMTWDDSISVPVMYESYVVRYMMVFLFVLTKNMLLSLKLAMLLLCCLAFIFTFRLAQFYFDDSLAALLAGLTYALMPFVLGMVNFHFNLTWFYALLPLSLLCVERMIKKFSVTSLLNAALWVGAVVFLVSPQGPFLLGFFLFAFASIRIFVNQAGHLSLGHNLLQVLLKIVLLGFLSFTVGSFYMFPRMLEYFPYTFPERFATMRTGLSQFQSNSPSLWQIITAFFYHELSTTGHFSYNKLSLTVRLFYLLFFVTAMSSSLSNRKRRPITLPFLIVTLLALLLTQGASSKLPGVILAMREVIPLFDLIRTPDRFLMFACLGCSLLFGVTLGKWVGSIPWPRYTHPLTLSIIIAIMIHVAVSAGVSIEAFTMRPVEYIEQRYPNIWSVRAVLEAYDPNSAYKIVDLSVPVQEAPLRGNFYSMGHRFWLHQYEVIERLIRYPDFARTLGELNVGTIVLSPNWGRDRRYQGAFSLQTRKVIGADPNFEQVFDNQINIWENKAVRPRLYTATPIVDFCGPISFMVISSLQDEEDVQTPVLIDPHTFQEEISSDVISQYPYWLALKETEQDDLIALSHPEWVLDFSKDTIPVIQYDYAYKGGLTFEFLSNNVFLTNSINEQSPIVSGQPVKANLITTYHAEQTGIYRLAFRIMPTTVTRSEIVIEVDGSTTRQELVPLTWQWVTMTVSLDAGEHRIGIIGPESVIVDAVMVIPAEEYLATWADWQPVLDQSIIGEWQVSVGQGQYATLVLHKGSPAPDWMFIVNTETFSPWWKARIAGQEAELFSIRTNFFVNGFYLPSGGTKVESIETFYASSPSRLVGSTLTLSFLAVCLILNGMVFLKNWKRLFSYCRIGQGLCKLEEFRLCSQTVFYGIIVVLLLSVITIRVADISLSIPPPIFDPYPITSSSSLIEEDYHLFGKSLILHLPNQANQH